MPAIRPWLILLLAAVPSLARAADVITLNDDVYLQWSDANDRNGKSGVCGFMIIGNHLNRANPHVVWDINIDEVWQGDTRVAGYTAGTFDVVDGKRIPRAPITALTFGVEGQAEPVLTRLVGPPNADHGIKGIIELDRAKVLFDGFSEEKWITITLTYADSTSEILRTRGFHEPYHGGRASPFNMCLLGKVPTGNFRRPIP